MKDYLDALREQLTLRRFTATTSRTYLNSVRYFLRWLDRNGRPLTKGAVVDFLLYMVNERHIAPGTQHTYLMSIRFFARRVVSQPELVAGIPQPKARIHPPIVPSRTQVRLLLLGMTQLRFRLMLMFAYGAGLRISEICNLQVSDIDLERQVVYVRSGKGQRPRVVMLGRLLGASVAKLLAERSISSPWLFPGKNAVHPTHPRTLQTHVARARAGAGLGSRFRCHSLRHAFATHLMESGVDLVTIQTLLGHANIRATIRYLHVTTARIEQTPSPLDALALP